MTRKKLTVAAVVGAVIICGVLTAVWLLGGGDTDTASSPQPTGPSSQIQTPTPSLTATNVAKLETALNSSVKAEQMQALVPGLRDDEWAANAVLPDGAKATITSGSLIPTQGAKDRAEVMCSVTGTVRAEFKLSLELVNGELLIAATERVG